MKTVQTKLAELSIELGHVRQLSGIERVKGAERVLVLQVELAGLLVEETRALREEANALRDLLTRLVAGDIAGVTLKKSH